MTDGKLSIGNVFFLSFMFSLLVALGISFYYYEYASEKLLTNDHQRAELQLISLVKELSSQLDSRRVVVRAIARDVRLSGLLLNNDVTAIREMEKWIKGFLPYSVRGRLLRPEDINVKAGDFPALGFADLEMLATARSGGVPPPIEAHLFKDTYQHFDIVYPVMSRTSNENNFVGGLIISYSVNDVQEMINNLRMGNGYVEIRQEDAKKKEFILLASAGVESLKKTRTPHMLVLPNTIWQFVYWDDYELVSDKMVLEFYIIAGVTVLLLGIVFFLFYRMLCKLIRDDLRTIFDVIEDVFQLSRIKRHYSTRLREFRNVVEYVSDMGQGLPIVDVKLDKGKENKQEFNNQNGNEEKSTGE